jgi:hypothetical protein
MLVLLMKGVYEVRHWVYLFFDPENGSDMFFRIVGWFSAEYMGLYFRRQKRSLENKFLILLFSLTTCQMYSILLVADVCVTLNTVCSD